MEDNRLCAIDLKSGDILWYFPGNLQDRHYCDFDANGYLYGNNLVFQYSKDARTYESCSQHTTTCINVENGTILWEENGKSGYNSNTNKPVVGDDAHCFFVKDSNVVCQVDLSKDVVTDFFDTDTLQINDIGLFEGYLAVSCSVKAQEDYLYNTYVLVLNKDTGEKKLLCNLGKHDILANCIISDGILYGNNSTIIKAVNLKTGNILWERDDPWAYINVDMFVYKGVLVKCSVNATTAYDARTGELLYYYDNYGSWDASTDGPYLYMVNRKGNIDIIDILTGKILDTIKCKYAEDGELFSGSIPTIYDGKLFMMSYNHLFRYPTYPW